MDEDLPSSPDTNSLSSSPYAEDKDRIDPKLLTKALNKMRGLVRGNGLGEDKITLIDTPENSAIKIYRFKARTSLKLIPQYGTRTEPGRNTTAEAIAGESEFRRAVDQIAIDARNIPQKRKQIIDFVLNRTDKGFGIKEQRTKFHFLDKDFVQHEKCKSCANTGHLTCTKCHGNKFAPCPKCSGRKYVICPRCRGDGKMNTPKGNIPCQFCRGDGRVNCKNCGARGQIKCQNCNATGTTSCRICAASGWISHLTHVDIFAQIAFDFDHRDLPPLLVQTIDKAPSRCIEKHDIEVSVIKPRAMDNSLSNINSPLRDHIPSTNEPEDTIWVDYQAMVPFGPITFKIDDKDVSGSLFGFQGRLAGFPFFIDEMIKEGQAALSNTSQKGNDIRTNLMKAAKFRLIADIITQTLHIKNTTRTKNFLKEKYPAAINPETISSLVDLTDLALRNITRRWRTIGLISGFIGFGILLEIYFLSGGRENLKSLGFPEMAMVPVDILMFPLGIALGVISSKFAAKWSQDRMLYKIVPADILKKTLPKAGKTIHWSIISSAGMIIVFLALAIMSEGPIPAWLNYLVVLTLSITRAG